MYNRYIPQPDGSFRRNRIPDQVRHQPPKRPQPPKDQCPPPQKEACPPPPKEVCPPLPKPIPPRPEPRRQQERPAENSIGGFLKHLLPKDFDTSDLIVVLLLLLLAGDCPEDQNTALLTLAIYLFL